MHSLDFSSWSALLSTLLGLAVITLLGVGIRLLIMQSVQQRRERENRQINERLRALMAAYKTLGGSFTGNLAVDPAHLRDLRSSEVVAPEGESSSSDRSRRIRDAVEAALSDIILLGTEDQVRLAAKAANDLVAGRPVQTDELVIALRDFIREVLDLQPVPASVSVPKQGPLRPSATRGGGKGDGSEKDSGKGVGNKAGGGGGGGGFGMGAGLNPGPGHPEDEQEEDSRR